MVWYQERLQKVLAVEPNALVEDGKKKKAEDEFATSEYVFAFGALEYWFREAQERIRNLQEDLQKAEAALSALQYAAEDVLDCEPEDLVACPERPLYEWLYQAQAAYLKAIKDGVPDDLLIAKRLEDDEVEAELLLRGFR